MISFYGNLQVLPNEAKIRNKLKPEPKIPRLDLTSFSGYYKGIEPFISTKGMIYYNLMRTEKINANGNRKASYYLQGQKSLNFSSIYLMNETEKIKFGFGEPNNKPTIKKGKQRVPNPVLPFKNDGYLFIVHDDYQQIEILICENSRYSIQAFAKKLANGGFDEALQQFRENAQPFFNY